LALCADYIVCGEKSVLGLPETGFGLIPGCTGTYILPRITSKAIVMEIILSGNTFTPEKALEWKIIHKIVPTKDTLESAIQIAKKLSKNFIKELKIV